MSGDVINLNPNISILDSTVLNDVVTEIVNSIGAVAETHNIELNDEFAQDMAIAMRFVRAGFARQMGLETDAIQEEMTKLAEYMLK